MCCACRWTAPSFYSHLRVFDAAGVALADQYMNPSANTPLQFKAAAAGSYYIGVSGYYNTGYDPNQAGSGDNSGYHGTYQLSVERRAAASSLLSGIQASATHGTPAQAAVASANVGQTITLTGSQLQADEQLVFTAIDGNGTLCESTVAAASVAANGTSLTVVVPGDATTGTVRLARDQVGVLLQIVPTLDDVSANPGQPFAGGGLTLTGSGFAEGASSVQFGAASLADSSRASGLDVYYRYNPNYTENGTIALSAPNGPTGPIRVSTVGGSSEAFALSFTGLVASATTGAAADAAQASANPGQLITIQGAGLDASTDVVFQTIDSAGNRSEVVVRPTTVDASGNSAQVVVPYLAVTGTVRVVGDQNATAALLQIVPVVQSIDVSSVSSDGSSAQVVLSGLGLIEDNASEYRFGASSIVDGSVSSGPDVSYRYDASLGQYIDNGVVYLSVPLSNASFGAITVRSAGGVSAPLSLELSGIQALALSGTPADADAASANAGQAITLQGSGLSTASDVLLRYVDSGGIQRMVLLNPTVAAGDGSSATLVVPGYANGAFGLQMLGASGQPLLQVVPTLSGYNVSGTTLQLYGSGLVEANASYQLAGASVSDTLSTAGPDVFYSGVDNAGVNLAEPVHGLGGVRVTTAGGSSAQLALNELAPGLGYLRDVAFDPSAGQLWVADNANPAKLNRIDVASGQVQGSITLSAAAFGSLELLRRAAGAGQRHDSERRGGARGQSAAVQRPDQPRPRQRGQSRQRGGDRHPGAGGQLRPDRGGVRPGQRAPVREQPRSQSQRAARDRSGQRGAARELRAAVQRDRGGHGHRPAHRQPVVRLGPGQQRGRVQPHHPQRAAPGEPGPAGGGQQRDQRPGLRRLRPTVGGLHPGRGVPGQCELRICVCGVV